MKKILFMGVILFTSFFLHAQSEAEGVRFMDNEPWENVLQKANEQNRWVFVDCYTSWCGPCKRLASEVFTQKEVGDFLNSRFVCVKYDVEKENGLAFARKYREYITAFPTLLMIRPEDGNLMHRIVGFYPAENILQEVQNGIDGRTWQMMAKEYEAGKRDLPFVKEYLNSLATANEEKRYQEVVMGYIKSFPMDSLMNKEIWELGEVYINDPHSEEFQYILHHLNDFTNRGFNRYSLEWKMAINIYYRVSDIVQTGFKTAQQDTVQALLDEIAQLQKLLKHPVKSFPEYRACLLLMESYLEHNRQALFAHLTEFIACRLLSNLEWTAAWADDLIEHLKSKEQIRQCVELLIRVQKEEEEGNNWVIRNCYGTIAKGYARLGDKKKAQEYYRMEEEVNKRNAEKMKNFGL
ncbi:MAG: thioredoxin family protein [Odoribacter sp.]|nr:thioredoxin family protein [Odoribacter sp.]